MEGGLTGVHVPKHVEEAKKQDPAQNQNLQMVERSVKENLQKTAMIKCAVSIHYIGKLKLILTYSHIKELIYDF